jgi:hypothetical protein
LATTAAPPAQQTVVTTVTRKTMGNSDPNSKPREFYARDWEIVLRDLHEEDWKEHVLRVYRAGERWEKGSAPVNNTFSHAISEEELRKNFGGGKFLLWLFGPPKRDQLVGRYQVEMEGEPIVRGIPTQADPANGNALAVALQQAMNPEVMRVQMEILKTAMVEALALVKSNIPPAQNPLETLRTAKEILGGGAPQTSLLDTIRLLKELGVIGSPEKKGIDELVELIGTMKTHGLIPGGAPKADIGSTIASNLPLLADRFVEGLKELRLQTEAAGRLQQTTTMRPNDPNVITVEANGQTPAAAAPPAQPASPPADGVQPVNDATAKAIIVRYNLERLVAGIKQPGSTAQDMYDFLLNAWPEVLDEMTKLDAPTLLNLFKSREMQMQLLGTDALLQVAEDPRLPQLLEDFLKLAKENAVPVA